MAHRQLASVNIALALLTSFIVPTAAAAPIVQPGAPGKGVQILSAEEAVQITDTSYSPADVNFMQMMIPHHAQALDMAELVDTRTNRPELVEIAGRIKASQSDEIEFMDTIIDVNKLIILAADVGHVHVMGRGTDILVLFVGEDVQSDHVDLGVAVLAGLGGGHFHDFAGTTLEKRFFYVLVLQL